MSVRSRSAPFAWSSHAVEPNNSIEEPGTAHRPISCSRASTSLRLSSSRGLSLPTQAQAALRPTPLPPLARPTMDLVHRRPSGPSSDQPRRTKPDNGPTMGKTCLAVFGVLDVGKWRRLLLAHGEALQPSGEGRQRFHCERVEVLLPLCRSSAVIILLLRKLLLKCGSRGSP